MPTGTRLALTPRPTVPPRIIAVDGFVAHHDLHLHRKISQRSRAPFDSRDARRDTLYSVFRVDGSNSTSAVDKKIKKARATEDAACRTERGASAVDP
jgi:hypothetical protein